MKKQKQNPKQVDSQLSKFVCRVKSAQNFNLLWGCELTRDCNILWMVQHSCHFTGGGSRPLPTLRQGALVALFYPWKEGEQTACSIAVKALAHSLSKYMTVVSKQPQQMGQQQTHFKNRRKTVSLSALQ